MADNPFNPRFLIAALDELLRRGLDDAVDQIRPLIEQKAAIQGAGELGWRSLIVDVDHIGSTALSWRCPDCARRFTTGTLPGPASDLRPAPVPLSRRVFSEGLRGSPPIWIGHCRYCLRWIMAQPGRLDQDARHASNRPEPAERAHFGDYRPGWPMWPRDYR